MRALCLAALALVTATASAGDVDAGKAKSITCHACHGANGKSPATFPLYPHLAGQKEGYLAKQMKAFRDGLRQDPVMSAMAKPLSDTDIANLAAYYASLDPQG